MKKKHKFRVLPQHKPTNKGRKCLLPQHNKQTNKVSNFVLTSGPIQKHIEYINWFSYLIVNKQISLFLPQRASSPPPLAHHCFSSVASTSFFVGSLLILDLLPFDFRGGGGA